MREAELVAARAAGGVGAALRRDPARGFAPLVEALPAAGEVMALTRNANCVSDDEAGAGVLVVLHDLDLAAAFADRVALMAMGRILACDQPGRVLTEARLTTVYGTPVRVVIDSVAGLRVLPLYPARTEPEVPAHVHRHEPLPRLSGAG